MGDLTVPTYEKEENQIRMPEQTSPRGGILENENQGLSPKEWDNCRNLQLSQLFLLFYVPGFNDWLVIDLQPLKHPDASNPGRQANLDSSLASGSFRRTNHTAGFDANG